MIAHEDGRVVAPARIGRRTAAPEGRLIHHIVVDEGRGVQELDHAAHADGAGAVIARHPARHEEEDGAETLAPGPRDELTHLVNQVNGRGDLGGNRLLDGSHLGTYGSSNPLP